MNTFLKALAVPFSAALLAGCAGNVVSKVEEPAYAVEQQAEDGLSIRSYPEMTVAEVTVTGSRDEAVHPGFRKLADYFFGENAASDKIPMTAPVRQQATDAKTAGEKIPMTAPVRQQATPAGEISGQEWVVQFVMPRDRTLTNLPQPNNPDVRLRTVPAAQYAVIQFSGRSTPENLAAHRTQLETWLKSRNLRWEGIPMYAFYNPPWVLPFLRRNEIWLALPVGQE